MRKVRLLLFALFLVLGGLVACSNNDNEEGVNNENENIENVENNEEAGENEDKEAEASFPVTVTDGNGESFTMEEEPEKIVSLIPSNTEIAYALGLGEKMVAGSDFDNYPAEALELEKIGGLELNIEAIVALEPDLVLAHPGNPIEGVEQLIDAGLTVFVVKDATNFEEVYESIETVGKITGTAEKAAEIIADMKEAFAEIEALAADISEADKKTVFIEISPAPEIYTPGVGTFENAILSLINAENGVKEDGWIMISEEAIIEMNPDFIVATYDFIENVEEQIMSRDGWQDITAVKEESVIVFDPDLLSRPGPRLVDGAIELAKAIYPDVFKE